MSLPKVIGWLTTCVVAIGLMSVYIDLVFALLTCIMVDITQALGLQVAVPKLQPDTFLFWDSCMMVLSIVTMILMTRRYIENWLLWVITSVTSVATFILQGIYIMSLEYMTLTAVAPNGSRMWINSACERESHVLSH